MSDLKYRYPIPYSCGDNYLPACKLGMNTKIDIKTINKTGNGRRPNVTSKKSCYTLLNNPGSPIHFRTTNSRTSLPNHQELLDRKNQDNKKLYHCCEKVSRERDFYASKLRTVHALCEAVLTARRKTRSAGVSSRFSFC